MGACAHLLAAGVQFSGESGSVKTSMLPFGVLNQSSLKATDFLHIFTHTRKALRPFLFVDKVITNDIWIGFTQISPRVFLFSPCSRVFQCVKGQMHVPLRVCVCVCVCVFLLLALNEPDHHYLIKILPVSRLTIKYTVINTCTNNRTLFHVNIHSVKYFTHLRKRPLMGFY